MNLITAINPDIDTIGLLYDLSEDSSTQAIADAKAFCDSKGIKYIEKNGTTTAEVQMAAEALVAAGVKAVFTPTDNTVMTAELSIYETFLEAGIQHFTGADSFALNGAFVGYGVQNRIYFHRILFDQFTGSLKIAFTFNALYLSQQLSEQ